MIRLLRRFSMLLALVAGVCVYTGCQSASSLPAIDQNAPGWTVRQGQAVWQPSGDKPDIAGDVVVSTHPSGGAYVQFSKTLPIVSGRIGPGGWEFEATPEDKRYSGRGKPPARIVWLQLLRALEGQEIPERWTVAHPSPQFISLEDTNSGERLELQFQTSSEK